jgi:hypothetical protein
VISVVFNGRDHRPDALPLRFSDAAPNLSVSKNQFTGALIKFRGIGAGGLYPPIERTMLTTIRSEWLESVTLCAPMKS